MSNAPRRRPAKPGANRRRPGRGFGIRITVDGRSFEVFQDELTGEDSHALRRTVGLSFMGVVEAFRSDPDLDLVAALVWLARRTHGEPALRYEDVARDITYNTAMTVDDSGELEPETAETDSSDHPEA